MLNELSCVKPGIPLKARLKVQFFLSFLPAPPFLIMTTPLWSKYKLMVANIRLYKRTHGTKGE